MPDVPQKIKNTVTVKRFQFIPLQNKHLSLVPLLIRPVIT